MAEKVKKKGLEVTFKMDEETLREYNQPTPKNHLRQGKLYDDFCILNQEFLKYVISCPLSAKDLKLFMFLLSNMDHDNKIIICPVIAKRQLGIHESSFNKHIKKLEDNKLIYKRNLGYNKGKEVLINFDIINPHAVFRNKNSLDNVVAHQTAMAKIEAPYIKQINIDNEIDLINPDTGEIFHTSSKKNNI